MTLQSLQSINGVFPGNGALRGPRSQLIHYQMHWNSWTIQTTPIGNFFPFLRQCQTGQQTVLQVQHGQVPYTLVSSSLLFDLPVSMMFYVWFHIVSTTRNSAFPLIMRA